MGKKLIRLCAFSLWALAVACGLWMVFNYEKSPGVVLAAPAQWPLQSPVKPASTGPTLLLFVHPQCPCTKATIGELAILMTHCHGKLAAYVFFLSPRGFPEGWSKDSSLWKEANEIPGVRLFEDKDGEMARYFKVMTSGQSLLYGQDGKLLFEGGITASRGHSGDNPGRSAITSLILEGHANRTKTDVFGCALFNPSMMRN